MTQSRAGHAPRVWVPGWVTALNVVVRRLLAVGVPIGPDMLLTVRGRRTGVARTTPVAICAHGGRRGVIAVFGESEWVRNLRAEGSATLRRGRHREAVRAVELTGADAVAFFRDVLAPQVRADRVNAWFVRTVDRIDIDRPEAAAAGRPVFELFPS